MLPNRSRSVPVGYWEEEIKKYLQKIKELEEQVSDLQERVDQYEWAIGVGDKSARH